MLVFQHLWIIPPASPPTGAQLLHIHPSSTEGNRTPVILHIVFLFKSHNRNCLLTSFPTGFWHSIWKERNEKASCLQCRADRDVVHSSGQRVQSASSMKSSVTQCAECVCTAISCGGEATCVSHVQPTLIGLAKIIILLHLTKSKPCLSSCSMTHLFFSSRKVYSWLARNRWEMTNVKLFVASHQSCLVRS